MQYLWKDLQVKDVIEKTQMHLIYPSFRTRHTLRDHKAMKHRCLFLAMNLQIDIEKPLKIYPFMQVKNRVEPSQGCKTPKLRRCLRQLKLQLKNHRLSFRVNARIRSAFGNVL